VGLDVGLQVEQGQLGGERALQAVQDFRGHRRRAPATVDQEHLLLESDPAHAGLEHLTVEHVLERLEIS
jgi:hypothetical protein